MARPFKGVITTAIWRDFNRRDRQDHVLRKAFLGWVYREVLNRGR